VDAAGELRLRRNLVLRNSSTATYRYQLTQLWSFESSLIGQLYDYEDDLRSDVFSVRGSGQLMRSLSPRMAIGAGSAITRQNFSGSERSIEQGATIGELFGVFYYRVTPT